MPKRTNPFQELTALIMAVFFEPEYSVTESVEVITPSTGVIRELDVLIVHNKDHEKNLFVECRGNEETNKKPRKQNVQWIDTLDGKARRLGFNRVIAVSSTGFSKSAELEGKERGIETLHLKDALETDWRKWKLGIEKLGVVVNILPIVTGIGYFVPVNFPGKVPEINNLDDLYLLDILEKKKQKVLDMALEIEKKPEVINRIFELNESNKNNKYKYIIPFDPNRITQQIFCKFESEISTVL